MRKKNAIATSHRLAGAGDYLVKDAEYEQIDSITLNRLHEVEKLPQDLKEKIFFFIDVTVRDFKTRQAYS